jgi:Domain of unknown function (DUF309)
VTVPDRIMQGGRSKAYRPLPRAQRLDAIAAGLEAYRRGEFFEAHELLEPAWMGTRDLAERDALQGLIKLAAAYVHAVRGNAVGVEKNLAGAQERLDRAGSTHDEDATIIDGLDLRSLTIEIGVRRATLAASPAALGSLNADAIIALVPPPVLGTAG